MSAFVGGYYLPFAEVHSLMRKLDIDERGVEETRLEFPINNWLAEQRRYNVLAGGIPHPNSSSPQEDGMLFIVRAIVDDRDAVVHLDESEKDTWVKEWLISEGGVKPEAVEWIALWDDFGLTLNGFAPEKNDISGHHAPIPEPMPDDQLLRFFEYQKTHKGFTFGEYARMENKMMTEKTKQ